MPEDVHVLIRAAALCVLLAGAAAAQRLPDGVAAYDTALSSEDSAQVARFESILRQARYGRRLLAETAHVARRQAQTGEPVSYRRGGGGSLVFDFSVLAAADPGDAVLHLARELRRASMDLSARLPQEEPACRQAELRLALELSAADEDFGARLRRSSAPEAARVANEIALFARDPGAFYAEAAASPPPRADASALGDNGAARAKEALDDFEASGAAELRPLARRWLLTSVRAKPILKGR